MIHVCYYTTSNMTTLFIYMIDADSHCVWSSFRIVCIILETTTYYYWGGPVSTIELSQRWFQEQITGRILFPCKSEQGIWKLRLRPIYIFTAKRSFCISIIIKSRACHQRRKNTIAFRQIAHCFLHQKTKKLLGHLHSYFEFHNHIKLHHACHFHC